MSFRSEGFLNEGAEYLGGGELSEVYAVRDLTCGDVWAFKVARSPEAAPTLRREFALLSTIRHRSVPRPLDYGFVETPGGILEYFTMSLAKGKPLSRVEHFEAVVNSLPSVLNGLEALHDAGIVHGDVKPEHIFADTDGNATLIDFSCAWKIGETSSRVSGTPRYLAPERLRGDGDARCDLYALGVTLRDLGQHFGKEFSDVLKRGIELLSSPDPAQRPSSISAVRDVLGLDAEGGREKSVALSRFVGRRQEREAARELVRQALAGKPRSRALWLHGPQGVGLSRCVEQLRLELKCLVSQERVACFDCNGPETRALTRLFQRASGKTTIEETLPLERFTELIGTIQQGKRCLLIIDAADHLSQRESTLLEGFLETLDPNGSCAMLVASSRPPRKRWRGCEVIELAGLSERELTEWVRGTRWQPRSDVLHRATEGHPASVVQVLMSETSGEEDVEHLRGLAALDLLGSSKARDLERLSEAERRCLAFAVAAERGLYSAELKALGLSDQTLHALTSTDWLTSKSGVWTLARSNEREVLARSLGDTLLTHCHDKLADVVAEHTGSDSNVVQRGLHLAHAKRFDEFHALLDEHSRVDAPLVEHRRALKLWLAHAPNLKSGLAAARALLQSGDPSSALNWLMSQDASEQVLIERAACFLALGETSKALAVLEQQLPPRNAHRVASVDSEAAILLARIALKENRHANALSIAAAALDNLGEQPDPALANQLAECRGLALSYLGHHDEARDELTRLSREHSLSVARDRFRLLGYLGINEYRAGRPSEARGFYEEALQTAKQHGLEDQLATAYLNAGSADHALGRLASALSSYERGERIARALTQESLQLKLAFNLARLNCDVGRFQLAERLARRVQDQAISAGLEFFSYAATSLLGECARWQWRERDALDLFSSARTRLEALGHEREACAVAIEALGCMIDVAPDSVDDEFLRRCELRVTALDQGELTASWLARKAALLKLKADVGAAIHAAQSGLHAATGTRNPQLQAELELLLAALYREAGNGTTADRFQHAARKRWEKMAAGLPPDWTQAIWEHPARQNLEPGYRGATRSQQLLARVVEINARLNTTLDTSSVLNTTIEAAIELVHAERGFVLLKNNETLEVAVARNFDGDQLPQDYLEFSTGIARSVMELAEPVLSIDAQKDARFKESRSVHEMRLRSVLAVPICAPDEVLGALYLDNRFRQGRFDLDDQSILRTFADQAGIALRNARLVEELKTEQDKVHALVAEQAEEIERLTEKTQSQQSALEHRYDYSSIVGHSAAMRTVFQLLDRITDSSLTVLIQGESGTGKELIARALHFNGPRKRNPFLSLNCAAMSEGLIESELFGHVRGAFTGATEMHRGLFQRAHKGTLLLDEIAEMSKAMQVKLLRVLQEGKVRPIGSTTDIDVDVRIVGATNRTLKEEVARGAFREDLYYRLAVVEVALPPLRERRDDIPLLAAALLQKVSNAQRRAPPKISPRAMVKLLRYEWPGNVRQLENVLMRAVVLAESEIEPRHLDIKAQPQLPSKRPNRSTREQAERVRIESALKALSWNISEVSAALEIPRATLYRKLQRYKLVRPKVKSQS